MIHLQPNHTYKISYIKGKVHAEGDVIYFQTLDKIPEAKHLIRVKNLATGELVDLIELLAHPWEKVEEHKGKLPFAIRDKGEGLLKAIIPSIIFFTRRRIVGFAW
jgi:hypothetical protein